MKKKKKVQQTKHEMISKRTYTESIEMYTPVSLCTAR